MVLFVNACARENSRTKRLADHLLSKFAGSVTEVKLYETRFPLTDEYYLKKRDSLIEMKRFEDSMFDMARQFAEADRIVIAAPYWDLSFPAVLKQYIEHINVNGITFRYTSDGYPCGLCRADKLYYVTTAGGYFVPDEFGYGYIKTLAEKFYGITETEIVSAAGLDIAGNDAEAILKRSMDYTIL